MTMAMTFVAFFVLFSLAKADHPYVHNFFLVDSETSEELVSIVPGALLDLGNYEGQCPDSHIDFVYRPNLDNVNRPDSVRFAVNGNNLPQCENEQPYTLAGSEGGEFAWEDWSLNERGRMRLTAKLFDKENCRKREEEENIYFFLKHTCCAPGEIYLKVHLHCDWCGFDGTAVTVRNKDTREVVIQERFIQSIFHPDLLACVPPGQCWKMTLTEKRYTDGTGVHDTENDYKVYLDGELVLLSGLIGFDEPHIVYFGDCD